MACRPRLHYSEELKAEIWDKYKRVDNEGMEDGGITYGIRVDNGHTRLTCKLVKVDSNMDLWVHEVISDTWRREQ